MEINITTSWKEIIYKETKKDYWNKLSNSVDESYATNICYPPKELVFACFNYFNFEDTKVVILGQDPYYIPKMANGLAFATSNDKLPMSLKNIYKELKSDLNVVKVDGDLSKWAKQGVLLLNNALTVTRDKPNSHLKFGWDTFTNNIIKEIDTNLDGVIFVLWGNFAQAKEKLLANKNNYVLKAAHPSPLSCHYGFYGCKHFSKINEILKKNNKKIILW